MKTSLVYGGKCTELLANYDQELQSWKMLQMSFQWADPMLLDRLPKSGMTVNGQLYALQTLEHHIEERDGFVLPTPTAQQRQSTQRRNLAIQRAENGIPLGKRLEKNGEKVEGGRHFTILDTVIYHSIKQKMLPTPTHHANNNPHTPSAWNRNSDPGVQYAKAFGITKEQAISEGLQLNPLFVEELMGFPIGWTELQP